MKTHTEILHFIEDTHCSLENAIGLLACLLEFVDEESIGPANEPTEHRILRIERLYMRLPQHAPLLRCALDILNGEYKLLGDLINEAFHSPAPSLSKEEAAA